MSFVENSLIRTDAIIAAMNLGFKENQSKRLVDSLASLNDIGKEKAVERVEELTEIPKYYAEDVFGRGDGSVAIRDGKRVFIPDKPDGK